ncbi:MAG: MscL family protein [Candidatus Nanohaloarchaea archaeon]|nr:MscL family protein [Candidatus Nanohaloarchaea archaeon]
MSMIGEFLEFLKEYKVVGLAIGIVVGTATTDLVNSVVDDIVMPLVGIFLPSEEWQTYTVSLASAELKVGHLIGSIVDFAIIALIVFLFVKYILKQEKVEKV